MTAKKILGLFGDYLRPRVRRLRPRGYERPSDSNTDIRFQAWLRVVTEPTFLDYERDLIACLVKCDGDTWQTERIAEFEMALSESLQAQPFVHRQVEESSYVPTSTQIAVSSAAYWAGVCVKTIHNWIDDGVLPCVKRGAYYYVTFDDLERVTPMKGKHRRKIA